ncbi:MAG: metallophosphoesterase [Nitrosomonas sp.]|nr:MAG: metallophosphoesterase [Nitrosomonas sp.]
MRKLQWIAISLIAAAALSGNARAQAVPFAVIGDMPYTNAEYALLEQPGGAIAQAIKALNPEVLLHLGDFKQGRLNCSDELLEDRYRQIAALHPHKTVYTPGDNDWTDCDRLTLSGRYDELERLEFLRRLFFHQDKQQLVRDIPGLARQQDFIENALWRSGPVVFATLHIPGTNNGRHEILRSNINDALDEADRRDRFNTDWLQQAFINAASAQAVVLAVHADIFNFDHQQPACTADNRTQCDGYKIIRDSIKNAAIRFRKPVLLIHGDTPAYCLNRPYYEIPNLWRLNAPGDYKYTDANRIVFDPDNPDHPFAVTGLLDQKPAPAICDDSMLGLSLQSPPAPGANR